MKGYDPTKLELLDLRSNPIKVTHQTNFNGEAIWPSASQDGKVIGFAEGRGAQKVSVLKPEGENLTRSVTWQLKEPVVQLRMSPSGDRFWTGNGLYDTGTGRLLSRFNRTGITQNHRGVSRWVAPDRIAEVASIPGEDANRSGPAIIVWDAESGKRVATAFSGAAQSIAVSPDGKWIAEGGWDKKIRIRNAETLEVEREFRAHDGTVADMAWHPKLPLLVSVSEDFTIKIWNTQSGVMEEILRYTDGKAAKVVMGPDGLAIGVYFDLRSEVAIYEPESFRGEAK